MNQRMDVVTRRCRNLFASISTSSLSAEDKELDSFSCVAPCEGQTAVQMLGHVQQVKYQNCSDVVFFLTSSRGRSFPAYDFYHTAYIRLDLLKLSSSLGPGMTPPGHFLYFLNSQDVKCDFRCCSNNKTGCNLQSSLNGVTVVA